ncbi:O-antigen ligase domain-containing protein [Lacrimispora sp.]|uniref:O-antigen ligase family protein n=1 Tax=Lacrimispora sp. TaxID=2719234 RepID=UPI0032E4032B
MENFSINKLKRNNMASIIYVCIILSIFPLVYHDYYFDMLIFKYQIYYLVTLSYIGFIIVSNTVDAFLNKSNKPMHFSKFEKLTIPELSIIFFMLIALISNIQSDFFYESFWGNEGRYTGLFTLTLYGISILLIIKYLQFKKWILYLFLISGTLACCFGITDYFKLDILGFKVNIAPNQYNMFMSTIGNVNSYTSYVALIMAVSTLMFSMEQTRSRMVLFYFCMTCSFFAIIMGLSDNSYLSLLTLFGFLPLYLFGSKRGFKRYLVIITTFFSVIYMIIIINKAMPDKVLEMQGIIDHVTVAGLRLFLIFMLCIIVITYAFQYKSKNKNDNMGVLWKYSWLAFMLIVVGITTFMIYDINILMNTDRYGSITQYLLFNDDWGTHRGFNWRIAIENYKKFSPIHKIFGYGPDTYGIMTHYFDYNEMKLKYNEMYDSAHNEYLQYFITMGPLSLISYLVFLASSIRSLICKSSENSYAMPIIFAVLCYSVQAVVNISVPIVTPIVFVLLASGLAENKLDLSGIPKENHH